MYCPKCGTANAADSGFCVSCGGVLPASRPAATVTMSPPPQPTTVTEHYFYAGFWMRFFAMIIDGIIVGLLTVLAFLTFLPLAIIVVICGDWLYHAILESSPSRATWGKQMLGMIVTDTQGNRISFARATGRHFGKIVSGLILYIGFIMAAFTARKQALHDMMADCLVLRR